MMQCQSSMMTIEIIFICIHTIYKCQKSY